MLTCLLCCTAPDVNNLTCAVSLLSCVACRDFKPSKTGKKVKQTVLGKNIESASIQCVMMLDHAVHQDAKRIDKTTKDP